MVQSNAPIAAVFESDVTEHATFIVIQAKAGTHSADVYAREMVQSNATIAAVFESDVTEHRPRNGSRPSPG
jgi:hypothetical protein